MKDRDFLIWIHERLHKVHGEDELLDYMHKLRSIISHTPDDVTSIGPSSNSIEELKKILEK